MNKYFSKLSPASATHLVGVDFLGQRPAGLIACGGAVYGRLQNAQVRTGLGRGVALAVWAKYAIQVGD
jgi:hypothetical protein